MPKLKTNKAVAKRFKVTKKGKVLSPSTLRRHMLTDRTPKNKRQSRGLMVLGKTDGERMKTMLPYGE